MSLINVKSRLSLLLLTFFFLIAGTAAAQVGVNTDSLFLKAQEQASLRNYKESRKLLKQVLLAAPSYTDAALLTARTYAWEEKFDSARAVLEPLYKNDPLRPDVILALADVERWAGNPERSLGYTTKGLALQANAVPLLFAEARALEHMQEYDKAETTLARLLKADPANSEALNLLEQVKDRRRTNLIGAGYQVTTFNKGFAAWQLGALEYTRITPKGKYQGRISYADRYEQRSAQFEVDAYPAITENAYLYVNAGFSDGKLFPEYRAGAELYHMLPHKFEASAGARLLAFPEENVVLFTGYLGKYFRKHWISFRPFLQQINGDWQTTGILQIRQYMNHADNHITLVLSQGSTPLTPVGLEEIGRLGSSRVGIESQWRAGKSFLVAGLLSYEYEEYTLSTHRNRYTVGLAVHRKF